VRPFLFALLLVFLAGPLEAQRKSARTSSPIRVSCSKGIVLPD